LKPFYTVLFFVVYLLSNAFAYGFQYSEWNLASYNGAYATINNGLIYISNGGSEYRHVQLTRNNIDLQAEKTYEIKFFLQGINNRHSVEVRIGRDGFPYDAFAEFGEVVATINGRIVTKTFKMQSVSVNNARLEFNLGKASGSVYLSDISLNCLDCESNQNASGNVFPATSTSDWGYVVVADTVDFRDYSMSLGNIFAEELQLGSDSKIYGDVDVSSATKPKPLVDNPNLTAGTSAISIEID
jgi:hypothetical protein